MLHYTIHHLFYIQKKYKTPDEIKQLAHLNETLDKELKELDTKFNYIDRLAQKKNLKQIDSVKNVAN